MGYTQDQVLDIAKKGRVAEVLEKKTFREQGLIRAAGQFLGMGEFGRGIAATIRNVSGETKRTQDSILQQQQEQTTKTIQALQEARQRGDTQAVDNLLGELQRLSTQDHPNFQKMADLGVSNREVAGSAGMTALNIASLGGALNLGAKAATGAATVRSAAIQGAKAGAVSGGLFGGTQAITEGEGVVQGAAKGAAFGAVTGAAIGSISKYIDDLTKVTPESRLLETKDAFKTVKRKFNEGAVYQGKGANRKLISDPITTLKENGIATQLNVVDGKINTEQARNGVRNLISELDDDVTTAIAGSDKITSLTQLKSQAVDAIKQNESLKAAGKVSKTINALDGYFDDFTQSYGDELSMESASAIRRQMNKAFNPDTVDVERAIGDVMRKTIYKNVPGTQQTLVKEGQLIAADKFLDALDGRAVKGGRLGGYFANLLGAMVGSSTDVPVIGPVAGALGANKIQQFMQSQQLNPITAKTARGITSLVEQLPTDTAGNVSKTAILNLIAQISNPSE